MTSATEKLTKDTRSTLGRLFDRLCGLFLIWLAGFLLLANIFEKLPTAFLLSVPLLILAAVLLKKSLSIIEQKRENVRKFWPAAAGEEETPASVAGAKHLNKRQLMIFALVNNVFRFEKAKSYFLFGLVLYGGYMLLGGAGFLGSIYLFFALLNIFMGVVCLYLGFRRQMTNKDN